MNILNQIRDHGVNISISGGELKLKPVEKVTAEIVALAKANRAEIIRELKNQKPAWCTNCCHYSYETVDGIVTLTCNQQDPEPVYFLDKCPAGYWIKDLHRQGGKNPSEF